MRGTYRDPAVREEARRTWAVEHVPSYMGGEIDPLRPLLSRHSGLVALDVGANKGFWTKALLNSFPGGVEHVHMFDPSPENFRELVEREDSLLFSPEDFPLISAHELAAGAEAGQATLHTNEDGSPIGSLYPHNSGAAVGFGEIAFDQHYPVRVETLDLFMAKQGLEHVDILKLDIEGHELSALKGADVSLSLGRIDLVVWEFGLHQVESRDFFVDFYSYLGARGFEFYELRGCVAHPIAKYSYDLENFTTTFIYAARRKAAAKVSPPPGFNEQDYLQANKDVANAIGKGRLVSGLHHWLQFGEREKRPLRPR
ncbi:MAG: FkbM family methyltransferase [Proteobacteria bacterium]|nr:FkbM family methyltransferase [Pseudomonadota bacterium]